MKRQLKQMAKIIGMTAMLLVLGIMLCGMAAPRNDAAPVRLDRASRPDSWKSNVMTVDPLGVFSMEKEQVYSVTFLDSTDDAPERPWYMGKGASGRVLGWVEWENGMANVYFAANGGINGKDCCKEMFMDCTNLTEVNFNGAFHTEQAESMKNMFYKCTSLKYVDLENLDTSNVTSMYQMFRECKALKELDVSGFDTSKVKSMYCMFSTCVNLTELDLSNFDTSRVTNMGFMFSACRNLEYVDVSSFDTSRVTNMEGVFRWCSVLEEPDLSGWDVSRVTNCGNFMDPGMTINGNDWERFF